MPTLKKAIDDSLNVIGAIALVGILLMSTSPIFNPQKAFAYRGGMFYSL